MADDAAIVFQDGDHRRAIGALTVCPLPHRQSEIQVKDVAIQLQDPRLVTLAIRPANPRFSHNQIEWSVALSFFAKGAV
jgi:hypothetical protein